MVLTKAILAKRLLKEMTEPNKQFATCFVEQFFEEISLALEKNEEVKLPGLGVFYVRSKNARPGRNPKTGAPVTISARHVVAFRSSLKLKAKTTANNKKTKVVD